ncbi:MAG: CPBP family intramembrane metalloprotease [Puniceicoccales bacterium]|nr:CPBP family intramembrane metalloprotease [Puniceicoccales bacterium]
MFTIIYISFLLILGTLGWVGWYWHREAYSPSLQAIWLSWLEAFGLAFAIFLVTWYIPGIIYGILGRWSSVIAQRSDTEWMFLMSGFGQMASLGFFYFLGSRGFWLFPKTWECRRSLGDICAIALKAFLLLLPCIWVLNLVWTLFSIFLVDSFPSLSSILEDQLLIQHFHEITSWPMRLIFFFCTLILAPITEELLFRYGFYRFLKGKWSARAACWATSVVFALMHVHWLSFVPLLGISLFLIHLYEREKHLMPCILVHMLFNANTFVLLFLEKA